MFPASALHELLIEFGLSSLDHIIRRYREHPHPFHLGQFFGLVASHIDQNEVQTMLHRSDIIR
jgi:hypothetical protein